MTPRKSISKKENKSPTKSNSNLLKSLQNDENKQLQSNKNDVMITNEKTPGRRSTRKSVAFNGKIIILKIIDY